MQTEHNFSKNDLRVWRINGYLILFTMVGVVLAGAFLLLNFLPKTRHTSPSLSVESQPIASAPKIKKLSRPESIMGTNYAMIPLSLSSDNDGDYPLHSSGSKMEKTHYANILILDQSSNQQHWIWNSDQRLIQRWHFMLDSIQSELGKQKVIGIIFETINKETNNDKKISEDDQKSIQYFSLTTKTLTTIVEQTSSILSVNLTSDPAKVAIVHKNDKGYQLTSTTIAVAPNKSNDIEHIEIKLP
ncbi:MAG: hypothetical protein NT027_15005 [Proteobacteria bacterium]|nr:hypothetical protein [Pseudomonadota bacterium]